MVNQETIISAFSIVSNVTATIVGTVIIIYAFMIWDKLSHIKRDMTIMENDLWEMYKLLEEKHIDDN